MGIGNTTTSSAIVAAITGREVEAVTGRGTGIDNKGLKNKALADHEVIVYGQAELFSRAVQFSVLDYEFLDNQPFDSICNCIVPVYALTEGISQTVFRSIIRRIQAETSPVDEIAIPDTLVKKFNLIVTKRVTSNFTGSRRSIAHGRGVVLKDHRKYVPGDDFRAIDWRVYARTDKLHVKRFEEERLTTGMLTFQDLLMKTSELLRENPEISCLSTKIDHSHQKLIKPVPRDIRKRRESRIIRAGPELLVLRKLA